MSIHQRAEQSILSAVSIFPVGHLVSCVCVFSTRASSNFRRENILNAHLYIYLRSYLFLNVLPFKYLIPTLYAKKFKLWLNIFLWCWYGFSIWNSVNNFLAFLVLFNLLICPLFLLQPILRYLNHQIYHFNSTDCIGNSSISRCILLKDTPEIRHQRILQRAVRDVRAANE